MRIKKSIAAFLLAAGCLLLHSCSEEWDKWETVKLEATSSFENSTVIDYQASSLTFDIKSNGSWNVELPEWMNTDNMSGTGDANIVVSIMENDTKDARTGRIRIQSGGMEPTGNIVGMASKDFNVKQEPKYGSIEFVVLGSDITRTEKSEYFYHYEGTVTYEIRTELSDEEITELITTAKIRMDMFGGANEGKTEFIENIPLTKGQHTVSYKGDIQKAYGKLNRAQIAVVYKVKGVNDEIRTAYITSSFNVK